MAMSPVRLSLLLLLWCLVALACAVRVQSSAWILPSVGWAISHVLAFVHPPPALPDMYQKSYEFLINNWDSAVDQQILLNYHYFLNLHSMDDSDSETTQQLTPRTQFKLLTETVKALSTQLQQLTNIVKTKLTTTATAALSAASDSGGGGDAVNTQNSH